MKIVTTSKIIVLCGAIVIASLCASRAGGHDHTLEAFLKARRVARARAAARVEAPAALYSQHGGTVNLAWLERGGAVEAETSSLVRHTLPRSKPRRRELVAAGGWLPATGAVRLGRDSG